MEDRTISDSSTAPMTTLTDHGLNPSGRVHWNLGWEELHELAVSRKEGKLTSHGVLLTTTGERTGGSPNDRFIVEETGLADEVWWGDVNRPISADKFERLLDRTRTVSYTHLTLPTKRIV